MPRHFMIVVSTISATAILATGGALPSSAGATGNVDPELSVTAGMRGTADWYTPDQGFLSGPSTRAGVPTSAAHRRVAEKLPKRSKSKAIGRHFAVDVVDIESGDRLWSRRKNKRLRPASNIKIVTAVTALQTMGPDKQFTTRVVALGRGKVALIGGGDPTLGGDGLSNLAEQTADAINSRPDLQPNSKLKVYVDDSYYAKPRRPSGYRSGYEPGIVRPIRALGMDGSYVSDSAKTAAQYFRSELRKQGIVGKYKGRVSAADAEEIATYSGARLGDQVRYMLQVSENNIAEMLYRNVAVELGYRATWGKSKKAATQVLAEMGVPTKSINVSSGSGVRRTDRLTAVALTTILQRAADKENYPNLEPIYYGNGLPLAGVSGTLSARAGRFTTRPTNCAAGRLRAKTGTLFDTISLSGIATGRDGKLKAFAVLVNSRPQRVSPLQTRRKVDRIPATITGCY